MFPFDHWSITVDFLSNDAETASLSFLFSLQLPSLLFTSMQDGSAGKRSAAIPAPALQRLSGPGLIYSY